MQILRKNGCLKPITWKELENGCWECTSHGKVGRGYAQIKPYGEKRTLVTRYLYEQLFGEIPDGMVVMHKCDNTKWRSYMNILGIIPARGGSKGIPQKNIQPFAGKCLIDWTIEVASKSNLSDIIVTSDCRITLGHAADMGIKTLLRPKALSTDKAEMLPVIRHAIEKYEEKYAILPNAICLLQPTSPLRSVKTINDCIEIIKGGAKSVTTVHEGIHPKKSYFMDGNPVGNFGKGAYDRHIDQVLTRSGSIFLTKTEYIYGHNLLIDPVLYKTDKIEALDLNDYEDWFIGEAIVEKIHKDGRLRAFPTSKG